MYYCEYKTKNFSLFVYADEKYLLGVSFTPITQPCLDSTNHILKNTVKQLDEYFAKKRTNFNLPLKLMGTDFQISVWKSLQKISYGDTKSYKDIATNIQSPQAVRAVGTANKNNPFMIIIPCHRIIKSNGDLGDYAGGKKLKEFLLTLEKAGPIRGRPPSL